MTHLLKNNFFVNWLYDKYETALNAGEIHLEEKNDEWYENEFKEFKKYNPAAGTFVKNITLEEFIGWIKKLKNNK